jgi:hypothetical protein
VDDSLVIREGEPLKLKRGVKVIPLLSVDLPVQFETVEVEHTQKTYMLKFVCPNGCSNTQGRPMTVRMTQANATVGVSCGACGSAMVEAMANAVEI